MMEYEDQNSVKRLDRAIASSVTDPSMARLQVAGLEPGGRRRLNAKADPTVDFAIGDPNGTSIPIEQDWRVRISISDQSKIFYHDSNSGIMSPLASTNGVIFPYTPGITLNYSAGYSSQKPTHSIYPSFFYESSEVQAIQITGDFTVQNISEGRYLLACIYFFRSVTKMFYGASSNAGNPPPLVFLDGFGSHYFPHVPVIVTSFQHVMSADVDFIEVPSVAKTSPEYSDQPMFAEGNESGGSPKTTRLPTVSQIQVGLQPVYSRNSVSGFSLDEFARGNLLKQGFI